MPISVKDIQEKEFSRQKRDGYNIEEVDDFLDEISDQLSVLIRENMALAEQVKALQTLSLIHIFYQSETTRINSIASWRTEATAEAEGVVSFYTDGYENALTPDSLEALTPEDIRAVIAGSPLGETSSRQTNIYRLVDQDTWYVAILTDGQSWNPVLDQEYYLQFEGFEDLVYLSLIHI